MTQKSRNEKAAPGGTEHGKGRKFGKEKHIHAIIIAQKGWFVNV